MEWPAWASSADDRRVEAQIEAEELHRLWDDQEPDEPTARGREEDKTYGDVRELFPEASER